MNEAGLQGFVRPLPIFALAALLAGCVGGEPAVDVLATFYPLAWAGERLAGGDVTVGSVVPSGVEPHDWDPSARDVARVGEARLLLAQGAGFEPWLPRLVEALGNRAPEVVDTTAGLPLRGAGAAEEHGEEEGHEEEHAGEEGHEGDGHGDHVDPAGRDPHTWLDPVLFARQVRAVEAGMAAAFPDRAEGLAERGRALQADLAALDRDYREGLAVCAKDTVVTTHDAFAYLGARYGFEVVSVAGVTPESEPSPTTLARVIDVVRERNVSVVFFEELARPDLADAIARETGARTGVLSPVEGLTPEAQARGDDYLALMRANLVALREALACG